MIVFTQVDQNTAKATLLENVNGSGKLEQTDEITGLVFTTYEERYVPGIDILGGALVVGALCFGLTFLLFKNSNSD